MAGKNTFTAAKEKKYIIINEQSMGEKKLLPRWMAL